MKNLFTLLFCMGIVLSLQAQDQYFGKKIEEAGAISVNELPEKMKSADTLWAKVSGKVLESCRAKGCWMDVALANGETMKVTFRDYGFFVPKGLSDASAVMEGVVRKEMMPVSTLKHYAKDAGKSQAEIDAIKEPQMSLTFEAVGVIIKDAK